MAARPDRKDGTRLPTAYVSEEVMRKFDRGVAQGDRGKVMAALVVLAVAAMDKHRQIWGTLAEHPENLEIRRKP